MKNLFLLLILILTSCGRKDISNANSSPQNAIIQYYEFARKGDVEKANSYLSSYDHKKFEKFPGNRTVGIEYIKKNSIAPRIDSVRIIGRFSAIAIVYKDPQSQIGDDLMDYALAVKENGEWKLVDSSRPYIDPEDWKITVEENKNILTLEDWYFKRKKLFVKSTNQSQVKPPFQSKFSSIKINDTEQVKTLISQGLNPNERNDDPFNQDHLLAYAVRYNAKETVRYLLTVGSKVDARSLSLNKTALFYASFYNNLEIAKILIENGADANALDINGNNALREAIVPKHSDMVRLLLKAGCKPDQKNSDGKSMRELAKEFGSQEIIKMLNEEN